MGAIRANEGAIVAWVTVGNPPGGREPAWKRRVAIDSTGTVYAAAALAGNEEQVCWCAGCAASGNVLVVSDRGHIYVPTQWLAAEYPEIADVCKRIERRVGEVEFEKEGP
jgi:hypothetical protein